MTEPEWVMVLVAFGLPILGVLWIALWPSKEVHTPSVRVRRPVPFTQPPGIEPTDPMVLCPSCRCMGYHTLDLVPAKPPAPIRSYVDELGDRVDIFTWQSAAGTAEYYRRQCLFCEHVWSVST